MPQVKFTGGLYNKTTDSLIDASATYNAGIPAVKYFITYNTRSVTLNLVVGDHSLTSTYDLNFSNALVVGDSIGVGALRFPALLAAAVPSANVDNQCQSGAAFKDYITGNLENHYLDRNYDLYVVEGGVNDILQLSGADATIAKIQFLLTYTNNKRVLLFTPPPFRNYSGWTSAIQAQLMDYIPKLKRLANEYGHCCVDLYTLLADPNDSTAFNPAWTLDGLHPNDAYGSPIIAAGMLAALKTIPIQKIAGGAISHEGATTNLTVSPRDFTNVAWTKSNITAALNIFGSDGQKNTASTLTASASNGTVLQAITSVSAKRVSGCYVKRITGTGVISITQDNGSTWTPITVTPNWALVTLPAATVTNPTIGVKIATNTDAIGIDYFQHELGAYVTSPYIGTRAIDSITLPLSANVNFPQDNGICLFSVTALFANSESAKSLICSNSAATDFIYDNGSGEIAINDGTNTATTSGLNGWTANDNLLIAACWNATESVMNISVLKNGNAWIDSPNAIYDGAFSVGSNYLFFNGNTDSYLLKSFNVLKIKSSLNRSKKWAKNNALNIARI